ncbi:uncharacterized protein BKA55DRAFT_715652 [Fusarium redolens]|uniref:Uncharacterized protein n=1 Tax=Fusarium redolens TaxID=48865 RepID=A0A9P9JMP8_FUSRE|nr:uncharacterized protein BKA55DRAFT_715652 [Fusarium redolens]KAH7230682.1 hypothetical protein BKA55DRAFT_715652 [Fusarium redolens]
MLSGLLISAQGEDDGRGLQSLINIADISTMELLHAMVQASRTSPIPLVIGDGQLCCNRIPKARFLIDTERYDNDHGEGAMQKVVTRIREERRQAAKDHGLL